MWVLNAFVTVSKLSKIRNSPSCLVSALPDRMAATNVSSCIVHDTVYFSVKNTEWTFSKVWRRKLLALETLQMLLAPNLDNQMHAFLIQKILQMTICKVGFMDKHFS